MVPTARPRHQITETPEVAHALNLASQRWPRESRGKLLVRLIQAGSATLKEEHTEAARGRLAAIDATSGKYADVFGEDYLKKLRQDWPE